MKKFRVLLAVLAVVFTATVGFTGCKFKKNVSEDAHMKAMIAKMNLNADENYEGNLTVWAQSKSTEVAAVQSFINSFKEKYPKIKVTLATYSPADYIQKVKNDAAAAEYNGKYENMPDVFWLANESIPSLVTQNVVAPINFIDDKDDSFSTKALVDTMVEDSKFGGNMYMMPRDYNQFVLYYNKWLVNKYGISMPDSDVAISREEFEDLAAQFHTKMTSNPTATPTGGNTSAGQVLDVSWGWPSMAYGMLRMFGGGVTDSNGNVIFDGEGNYNALKWIKETVIKGWSPTIGADNLSVKFKLYEVPFLIDTRATFMDIVENATVSHPMNDDIGVMPLPVFDTEENYAIGAGCSGYAMYYNAVHPTEAWLFLKHVVSKEGQNAYGKTGNSVPVLKSLIDDDDAEWRNLEFGGRKLSADFNHDAFVYKYDTNSCTMAEFKSAIPAGAVARVAGCMATGVSNAVKNTTAGNYIKSIQSAIDTQAKIMRQEIKNKK